MDIFPVILDGLDLGAPRRRPEFTDHVDSELHLVVGMVRCLGLNAQGSMAQHSRAPEVPGLLMRTAHNLALCARPYRVNEVFDPLLEWALP